MKKIRNKVFETNSSSCHSISIADETKEFILDMIYPDDEGNIILDGGEFGWEWFKSNNALFKANYACVSFLNNDYATQKLKDIIKEQTGCNEVIIKATDDYPSDYSSYIDHESSDIVSHDVEDLKNFIFNKNSWLFGGNDNSVSEIEFFDVPEYTEKGVIEVAYKYELSFDSNSGITKTFKFKKYPDDKDIENIASFLFDDSSWIVNNEYFNPESHQDVNVVEYGFIPLYNEKEINYKLGTEKISIFKKLNFDNPKICYKLYFTIKKLN
jgi:hypothetical protein